MTQRAAQWRRGFGWFGCFGLAAFVASGAQTIPPTAPTRPPASIAVIAPPVKAVAPTHRARVAFAGQTLEVKADNSSLNQILRDIGHATGMKITGGVPEERVYGTYGPAETSTVLTTLLGGTGSNMLLIVDSNNQPTELVITPRQGGPTPPNPNASRDEPDRDDDNPDTPPQLSQHVQPPPARLHQRRCRLPPCRPSRQEQLQPPQATPHPINLPMGSRPRSKSTSSYSSCNSNSQNRRAEQRRRSLQGRKIPRNADRKH